MSENPKTMEQLTVPEHDSKPDNSTETTQPATSEKTTKTQISTRSVSPSTNKTKIENKFRTQFGRLHLLTDLYEKQQAEVENLDLAEVEERLNLFTGLYEAFSETHSFIEENSPASLTSHRYFTEEVFNKVFIMYSRNKMLLSKAKAKLIAKTTQPETYAQSLTQPRRRLPDISLPTFTGEYSAWLSFRDLFKSMVISNKDISNVERMHYLKSSLSGQAAQLIANLPISDDSFDSAWSTLNTRFENKRLLIAAQFDKLLDQRPLPSRSAGALNSLISKVNDSMHALKSLEVDVTTLDMMTVHALTKVLDSSTREQWEVKLGSSTEYPKLAQLIEFLTARARALERLEPTPNSPVKTTPSRSTQPRATLTTHHTTQSNSKLLTTAPFPCDCCKGDHYIVSCPQFRQLTPAARLNVVNSERLCFNCFGHHNSRMCQTRTLCKTLRQLDHPLQPRLKTDQLAKAREQALLITSRLTHTVRLLLDPGSELTFISNSLVRQLQLQRIPSRLQLLGVGGVRATHTRGLVNISLRSLYSNQSVSLSAHVLNVLTSKLPSLEIPNQDWNHLRQLQLADPDFLTPRPVDLIIGADSYGPIIQPDIVKGLQSEPIAQLTIFGWTVLGPVFHNKSRVCQQYHASINEEFQSVQDLLTKFWIQEEVPANKNSKLTPDEEECEAHFVATHTRDSSGRYIVRLPLKSSVNSLGDSHGNAQLCLQRLLRRLKKDSTYHQLYSAFLAEYAELNHMVRAPISPEMGSVKYYLPHHGVLRPESSTTKLRVVFNGSSNTTTGVSLNDLMHTGEKLQLDIIDVLLEIRRHRFLFATDITKMFRQIKVHEDDWDKQRILWVDDQLNIVPFQLTTVTYGTKAAPFLAGRTLLQLVKDEGHHFPLAIAPLTKSRYVDDIFGGADNLELLSQIADQLKGICMAGGFPLAKWQSNHKDWLRNFSSEDSTHSSINFEDCETKILGLSWHSSTDEFQFTSKGSRYKLNVTKRVLLSEIARLYDPLGFLSPLIVRAKMLLQELWQQKLNWDDSVSPHTHKRWLEFRSELATLHEVAIPRWLQLSPGVEKELHGFSDASQLAMSAVIYLKVISPSTGVHSTLVCAKSKIAPLTRLTIPRLELTAALLLSRLMKHVKVTLQMEDTQTYMWTDSSVALTWINSHPSRWKDFVRNRVTAIQEHSSNCRWRFVPGRENPADCATRGLSVSQLKDCQLWWTGPPWLLKSTDSWPASHSAQPSGDILEERPGLLLTVAAAHPDYHWELIYRYSSLIKLYRVTAICRRAINVMRKIPGSTLASPLTPVDLDNSRLFWIKTTQAVYFQHELRILERGTSLPKNHVFQRLTAFIDAQGVLRVGGRLSNSKLDPEAKHLAILPREARLTHLLIADAHSRTLHGGTQLTLSHLRRAYWIIGGRAPVRSYIRHCMICARQRGKRAQQLMGQLPEARVNPSRPFTHTGIDYAGPILIKTWRGRGAKQQKGWICLFVCFATSAVHIETVCDYSTESFIAAYRRFISRRGICSTLYSDCGTNFIGANTQLQELFTQGTHSYKRLSTLFTNDGTTWKFNPPAAPHMGGKWEAAIKSVKYHLKRTIGDTPLTLDELNTLLTQIEAILNSRPLEPLTDDPDDLSALTPGHFLIGTALTTLPEPALLDIKTTRLSRWQLIQQQTQQFWSRWSSAYLQRQLAISKWWVKNNQIKVGSLVLISDERLPPSKWPLARVTQLHPGKDNLTRVVTLRTATTTLTRPIVKLAVLPVNSANSEEVDHS